MSTHSTHSAVFLTGIVLCLILSQLDWPRAGLAEAEADQLIPCENYRLKNGLQVILHEDHRAPFVAVQVTYHFGPLYEQSKTRGVAHLIEHLMEGSTEHLKPGTPGAHLRRIGAVKIHLDLEPDRTDSWSVVPSANLEPALWVESDRMGFRLPAVTREDIATNKKLIELEDHQRLSTVPYVVGDDQLSAALIPLGHSFSGNWRGIVPAVSSPAELAPILRRFYAPSNATLVLAGDFTWKDAVSLVDKYFSSLPTMPPPAMPQIELGAIEKEVVFKQTDAVARRPRVRLGWLAPALKQADSAVAELVALLLDRGTSGRLYEQLIRPAGLAQDVRATRVVRSPQSLLLITAYAERETALPEIVKGIDAVLQELASTEVSADELTAVKRRHANQRLLQLHDILNKAHLLQTYNHHLGMPDGLDQELARIEQVSAAQVQKFVRDYLAPAHRIVLYSMAAQQVVISGEKP